VRITAESPLGTFRFSGFSRKGRIQKIPSQETTIVDQEIILISPARDEERYIETTITCMINQMKPPKRWIIVNDGSKDRTSEIIHDYMSRASFIRCVDLPDRGFRKPGQGVIEAFYEGYRRIGDDSYTILSKFDADLDFPPHTLERICGEISANPRLGITGGPLFEPRDGKLINNVAPKGYVQGPVKFYRRECFDEIGGLISRAGWDGVDVIRANKHGWETYELPDLRFIHLRSMGTAIGEGLYKACMKYGDSSYYMGGYLWHFTMRAIGRSIYLRNPLVGFFMMKGFLYAMWNRIDQEPIEYRRFLRQHQVRSLTRLVPLAISMFFPPKMETVRKQS